MSASACHGAPLRHHDGEEGTQWFTCSECGQPADPAPGSWTARFLDGPCKGSADRVWAVGPPHHDLFLMPEPSPAAHLAVERGEPARWILIGYDGLEPESPWPGQVQYRLELIDDGRAEDGGALCWYRQVSA